MLLKKQGYPEDGELVFCTVTNVQYNSVFVKIESYEKSGLIHISEISPGRIRNIRDFVKEGKMIVCKVIKIDEEKGHIDLSLRRVTEMQKKQKTEERKQEQKAEKIIESLAQELKKDVNEVYKEVASKLIPKYELLQYGFEDLVENNVSLKESGLEPKLAEKLELIVKDKIKPKQVEISGVITLQIYSENGVDVVKKALMSAETQNVKIKYLGAGKHSLTVDAKNYKDAERDLKQALDKVKEVIDENKGLMVFKKNEKD
jgi:translation initiation factor 2 subunit 1